MINLTETDIEPYLDKKFIARSVWVVYLVMAFFEIAWSYIAKNLNPASGSFMEQLAGYLKLAGGNALIILPVYFLAFIADRKLSDKGAAKSRNWRGRAMAGVVVFVVLWGFGALIAALVAFVFSFG